MGHDTNHGEFSATKTRLCSIGVDLAFCKSPVSNILGKKNERRPREGETLEYDMGRADDGRPRAVCIKRVDPRLPLFKFATTRIEWVKHLKQLEDIAQDEDWNYRIKPREDFPYPVLESYIIYTFDRLQHEGKVAFSEDNRSACFNTGLVSDLHEEIFAYFEVLPKEQQERYSVRWELQRFCKASDRILLSKFNPLPELAHYFDHPSDLLYDGRKKKLVLYMDHILERIDRFPEFCRDKPDVARQLVEGAQTKVERRVRRNYKTAIPQFFQGKLQLLLPLCLEKADKADLALVVEDMGQDKNYRGNTVLPLDWAYNNARLITRPDDEWLKP